MVYIRDLKPPLGRTGNKFPLRDIIIPLIPPHKRYVELFAGSAAIFYNKEKATENILNDLDKETAKGFQIIKKAPTDPTKYREDLNTIEKQKHFFENHSKSAADALLLQKIKVSSGFQGFPVREAKNIYRSHNPYSMVKKLPEYKELLEGVKITNSDYETIVKQYDSPSTFFFIDPPYENSTARFGYAEHESFDFERLKKVIDSIKGDFLLTLNDSPRIRDMYKSYHIRSVNVDNQFKNIEANKKIKKVRKELFITNFTMSRAKH